MQKLNHADKYNKNNFDYHDMYGVHTNFYLFKRK